MHPLLRSSFAQIVFAQNSFRSDHSSLRSVLKLERRTRPGASRRLTFLGEAARGFWSLELAEKLNNYLNIRRIHKSSDPARRACLSLNLNTIFRVFERRHPEGSRASGGVGDLPCIR